GSEEKEKKKDCSPVRSSSTSKDSGSSEKSSKKSGESPTTPTTPTAPITPTTPPTPTPPPRITSFPPAPVTTNSVRNKCRELLVAALQTDDDHKTIGVDCEHLAAQIEEDILSCHRRLNKQRDFTPERKDIFQEFKSTDMKYKSRLRSRISNLKDQKNPDLRRNVLCGNISAQRIASMTAETRSADEPMTTFVLCNSCGNRWKELSVGSINREQLRVSASPLSSRSLSERAVRAAFQPATIFCSHGRRGEVWVHGQFRSF
ncbi:Transcription elongation factor A protein 2, partial [Nibea albiflora]